MMSCREVEEEEKLVCVTGASGFIASWLVKLLLQRGYTVKATVGDPYDRKKTEHLLLLDGAKESFICSKKTCWKKALLILCFMDEELIDPALKGTLNVLGSCAKTPSVKRVVITSSMAAVAMNGKPLADDVTIDESWFSDPGFSEKNKLWYHLSKTLAGEAAWNFAKEKGIDIITINPGWVIGPLLQPTLNSSVQPILKLVDGTETFPNITHRFIDARDVANAHILAFERPSASGRYCLVGSVKHCSEIVKMLRDISSDLNLPDNCADDKPFAPTYQVSKERAKSLGVKFTPLEVSLKDTVESLKHKKV